MSIKADFVRLSRGAKVTVFLFLAILVFLVVMTAVSDNPSGGSSSHVIIGDHEKTTQDNFVCGVSYLTKVEYISFDKGIHWSPDTGLCQAREEAKEQAKRAEDAQFSSYWPTTLRVDTDMDSFWLNNEERTCKTYPGNDGRVGVVACSESGNHRDHNIPVKFWGGVDRNKVSDWKCRREDSNFVCRALD